MNTAREIESAIERLSPDEQERLALWFEQRFQERWDTELQEDAAFGKLDALYSQLCPTDSVEEDKPLDEFLDDEKLP